jgi:hypothetical protein
LAVGFRSSSIRGVSDTQGTSIAIPVPSGAAAGDIVICFVGQFDHFGAAITAPTGFTQFAQIALSAVRVTGFWKRLTASDTGSYTFSWASSSTWANGNALCITGALATGDPIEDFVTGSATGTAYPDLTVTTVTAPFLAWGAYNENADTTHDVPDSYTGIDAQDYGMTAWRVPATTGTHTATGATAGVSTNLVAILAAIAAEAGGIAVGQALETNTAGSVTASKTRTLDQSVETDTAQIITASHSVTIGQALESDTAHAVAGSKRGDLGQSVETDTAQSITVSKSATLGQAVETDTASSLTATVGGGTQVAIGQAVETHSAFAITGSKSWSIGQASETDTASGVKLATQVFHLISPTRVDIWPVDWERLRGPTFRETRGLTVYGDDTSLTAAEMPAQSKLDAAKYVFYGGYENTTTDKTLRRLWLDSGFEVEQIA